MKKIGFLTDWEVRDGSVAVVKAVMKSIAEVEVIDISHTVADIKEGAFVLATSYCWFPKGTIFLAVVDPGVGTERKPIIVETEHYLFVGPDNGLFSFLNPEEVEKVIRIQNDRLILSPLAATFEGRDIFGPVAAFLVTGTNTTECGPEIEKENLVRLPFFQTKKKEKALEGEVIFIDDFGNLVTSIRQKDFLELLGESPYGGLPPKSSFKIKAGWTEIKKLSKTYADGKAGEAIALFGGDFRWCTTKEEGNLLEIAVNQGNASQSLGIGKGEKVIINIIN